MNQKVAKVPGKSRGPSITLKVMAGDTIEISAKAFYNIDKSLPGKGVDIAPVLGTAIAAMTNPVSGALDEAAQLAVDLGATASNSATLVQVPKEDQQEKNVQPESGLKFVLYDSENFKPVEANSGVRLVEDKINVIQNLHTDKMVMQQAGFLEIYLDNQAQTPVFFDNFIVTQSTGPVKEVNAYYPYGMIIGGLSFQAAGDEYNAYKYNGKELQDLENFKLGWLDYGARMLDGPRWFVPDPMAEKYYSTSPYMYVLGNSISNIDVDGLFSEHYGLYSTFITGDSRVIFHIDDGDNRVFRVDDVDKWIENGRTKEDAVHVGYELSGIDYSQIGKLALYERLDAIKDPPIQPDYTIERFVFPVISLLADPEVITEKLGFSKTARGNQRETWLEGVPTEDIEKELKYYEGKKLSKEENKKKEKLIRELKDRTQRNKQKKQSEKGVGTGRKGTRR